jgi:hypothetical protein
MPQPVDPGQDIEPWKQALATLTGDRAAYEAEADASRQAAMKFVCGLRPSQFEEALVELAAHGGRE